MRTEYSGLVDAKFIGQTVTLFGWVHRRRDHGGVIFIDLRDRAGLVQVVCDPDRADVFANAEKVRNEYCLRVTGLVRKRPEGTVNANLVSGEIEVLAHELTILNPSIAIPFQLDDENLSETTRLTHRVLDLRRLPMQKNLMLRYRTAMAVPRVPRCARLRRHRDADAHQATPEGARDYLVPSRVHAGRVLRAAAVAAAVQAAADDRRLRPVLPDRQVLPRRGPARRPPAGVHADRHRDLVPRRNRDPDPDGGDDPDGVRGSARRSSCRTRSR